MEIIEGGITAPKGFLAAGIKAGIKKGQDRKDLAIVYSEQPGASAATYTTNRVKGQPLVVTMEHLADGQAQAIIVNSGNANTCTGEEGIEHARLMAHYAAKALNLKETDVIVASTGVIGQRLNIEAIEAAVPALAKSLSKEGYIDAREAIMTTDTVKKDIAVRFDLDGVPVTIGAMAKGSGMIHVNMATMLCFITTDVEIEQDILRAALRGCVERTLNQVSVDGDTSTNDMCAIIANGMSGAKRIFSANDAFKTFTEALTYVLTEIAKMLAGDGEGATKRIECSVDGAQSEAAALVLSKGVVSSNLLKAAIFGADANWGRILCAMGKSEADFDPETASVDFESTKGNIAVCREGKSVDFDEVKAKEILGEREIRILVRLGDGEGSAKAWGCDLTYDYVKINGDYRS